MMLILFRKEMDKKIVVIISLEGKLSAMRNLPTFVDQHFARIQKYLLLRTVLDKFKHSLLMVIVLKS